MLSRYSDGHADDAPRLAVVLIAVWDSAFRLPNQLNQAEMVKGQDF